MELIKQNTQAQMIKSILVIILGSVLLAVSAKIKIPFYPVPMTMQTLIVLVIGIGFGWKLGLTTVSLYLFEGIIGLPVFSGTPEKGIGLIYFTGPTMGYLIGFLVAVYISGKFNYDNNNYHCSHLRYKRNLVVHKLWDHSHKKGPSFWIGYSSHKPL